MSFSSSQILPVDGAWLYALATVIAVPDLLFTFLVSVNPSGKITLNFALSVIDKSVASSSSTVITVVEAAEILPPLLIPLLTGSIMSMTIPGLTTAPPSIDVLNVMISDSLCSVNAKYLPRR